MQSQNNLVMSMVTSPFVSFRMLISLTRSRNYLSFMQAVIFVDNSGADVILGVLPFARELLRRGTMVCLLFI